MQQLERRLAALENTVSPIATLESSTRDIARFLARVPPSELAIDLAAFSDSDRVAIVDEIQTHVPGYGGPYALA